MIKKNKSKLIVNGLCYQKSLRYILDHNSKDLYLVHGNVTGRGPIQGIRYGHAWIEDRKRGVSIDLDKKEPSELPLILYYYLGRIKRVKKYTRKEALEQALKTGHYGPWK